MVSGRRRPRPECIDVATSMGPSSRLHSGRGRQKSSQPLATTNAPAPLPLRPRPFKRPLAPRVGRTRKKRGRRPRGDDRAAAAAAAAAHHQTTTRGGGGGGLPFPHWPRKGVARAGQARAKAAPATAPVCAAPGARSNGPCVAWSAGGWPSAIAGLQSSGTLGRQRAHPCVGRRQKPPPAAAPRRFGPSAKSEKRDSTSRRPRNFGDAYLIPAHGHAGFPASE
jgi:hypothetical protein